VLEAILLLVVATYVEVRWKRFLQAGLEHDS
jgi:hypothetical protein